MWLSMWIEALAACAIEGNKYAQEMLALRESAPKEFMRQLVLLAVYEKDER